MKIKLLVIFLYLISSALNLSYCQNANPQSKFSVANYNVKYNSIDTLKVFNPTLITTAVTTTAPVSDGNDIRIFPSANEQSEVHISISRHNPSNLLMCANTYVTQLGQGYYVSHNCGLTWTGSDVLQHPVAVDGDPSTGFDANGNAYISTIVHGETGYFLQSSTDGGINWSNLTPGVLTTNLDKEMIGVDDLSSSPYANNIYCAWTELNTPRIVRFNRSTDGGQNFSQPITLLTGYGQGTNVQTGINGEVYVCWANYGTGNIPANGVGFTLSTNGGVTFSTANVIFAYSGIRDSDYGNPLFGNTAVVDYPSMAVDKSNSAHRGRIYIVYPTKENGNGKAVIQVRFSDNNGTTWSSAQTISISNGRQNWFPWISVDPISGIVSIVYYTLDGPSGFVTNTYLAYSFDGGATYTNLKVSDVSHITAPINPSHYRPGYCGDYIGVTSYNDVAFPAWMDNRNGTWQVYMSRIHYTNISGPAPLCSSGSYTVNNLPTGATITWDKSSNISRISTQGSNPCTFQASGVGDGTIFATIKSNCDTFLLQYPVFVGVPLIGSSTYTNKGSTYPLVEIPNLPVSFDSTFITNESLSPNTTWINNACYLWWVNTTMQIQGQSSVTWTKVTSTPSNITWSQNGNDLKFYFYSLNQTATFNISAHNSCGNTVNGYNFASIDCGSGCTLDYTLSPNPASTMLSIIPYIPPPCGSVITNPQILQVTFYDTQGNPKKIFTFGKGTSQVQIDISSLNIGTYILDISDGTTSVRKMLMIQR